MYQTKIFSFILVIYNLSPGNAEVGSGIHKDTLVIKSSDESKPNGIIVKRLTENLTLSCHYLDQDNSLNLDRRDQRVTHLSWRLPNDDVNRTRTSWIEGNTMWLSITRLESKDAGTYTCVDMESPELIKVQAYVAVKTTIGSVPYCGRAMLSCSDNADIMKMETLPLCVALTFVCDGKPDCSDPARDESPERCGVNPCEGKILCRDGRCIPRDWCCYGKSGCIPHSCCAEMDDFTIDRTGGPLRRKPSGPPLLQTTLYTVIVLIPPVCLLVFLVAVILLISAICKARLKRAAIYRERAQSREMNDYERMRSMQHGTSDMLPDYHSYTLISGNDPRDASNSSRPVSPDSNPTLANRNGLPTYSDAQINIERHITENADSPARRPTDFGGGTLSNAIFNSRYRPIPQNVTDIPSFVDITDSDSSCLSPGSHVWANRDGTRSIRLYPAASFGESPSDSYNPSRRSDDRRIRRANALDRILDRFGLNPPYAVDAVAQIRSDGTEDLQNDTERRGRRRFVSSILSRLRNGLSRNRRAEECGIPQSLNNANSTNNDRLNNNGSLVVSGRRRPDTPNVLELTPDCDLRSNGETYTLNGRTIRLLGGNFENRPDLYNVSFQGLYIVDGIVGDLNNFVGRPVSPPPYSEIANAAPSKVLGPPPPYMSRENLNVMETEFNSNNNTAGISNSNANTVLDVVLENAIDNTAFSVSADVTDNFALRDDHLNGNFAGNTNTLSDVESSSIHNTINNNLIDLSGNIVDDSDDMNVSHVLSRDDTAGGEVNSITVDNNLATPSCSATKHAMVGRQSEHRPSIELTNLDACSLLINKTLRQINTIDSDLNFAGIIRGDDLRNGNVNADTSPLTGRPQVKSTDRLDDQNSSVLNCEDRAVVLDRNDNSHKPLRTCVFPPVNLEFIDSDCVTD